MAPDRVRLLIFIVAYNAERHIEKVLARIPRQDLHRYDYEVLIIDDQSEDATFERALDFQKRHRDLNLTVLFNPQNQGYGGNQKLGYHYAQINRFDIVLLLHGDGQYAPEEFDRLVTPIAEGRAEAVFGSRMLNKREALKGKMPYYKFVGNIILTRLQNRILGTHLSEFHSGYRAYSVQALSLLPIECNSNDFHFDTQIIIQFVNSGKRILEVPVPTHYGSEICYVNGLQYAYNILKASLHSRFQRWGVFYKREYDFGGREETYSLKTGYTSSHSLVIERIAKGSKVLDIGDDSGLISNELEKKGCEVTQAPLKNVKWENIWGTMNALSDLPLNRADSFDVILVMDLLERLEQPERLLDLLRENVKLAEPDIYISVANIGFFITRFQLLFGEFNYGRRGILDLKHKRLFTMNSIKRLCEQSGMKIIRIIGVPAPYPEAFGLNRWSIGMVRFNSWLIRISKRLFSYEFVLQIRSVPMAKYLIKHTLRFSERKANNLKISNGN